MKYADKLHNTLTYSDLLPPPISLGRKYNTHSIGFSRTLLHQAIASCGRAFCFLLLLLLPLAFVSCEKPDLGTEMEENTRSGNHTNDSTGVVEMPIVVDTTWAGTITVEYGL